MQRLFSYRQGDRAEYLAQYILSAIAISIPVPRQEDTGDDFHCSLLRREGKNLFPYLPFNLQVKRHSRRVLRDGIKFGGLTKTKKWKKYDLAKLCELSTPFLIALVNPDEQWIDFYGTFARYFVAVNWEQTEKPREVVLLPDQPEAASDVGRGEMTLLEERADMPRGQWKLPLGQRIVRMTIQDSEDKEQCEQIKGLLEPYIRLDQQNSVFMRQGIGTFDWPLRITPDQVTQVFGSAAVLVPPDSPVFMPSKLVLCKIVASMLRAHQNLGQPEAIRPWLPIVDLLPIAQANGFTQRLIADVRQYMAENPGQASS